jgi:hypothetical protein
MWVSIISKDCASSAPVFGGAAQALKPKTQPARVKFISALFARQRVDSGAFDVPVDTTLDMSPNPSLDRL